MTLTDAQRRAIFEMHNDLGLSAGHIARLLCVHINQVRALIDVDYLAECRAKAARIGQERAWRAMLKANGGVLPEERPVRLSEDKPAPRVKYGICASGINYVSKLVGSEDLTGRWRGMWISLPRVSVLEHSGEAS